MTPSEAFRIPKDELNQVIDEANKGDLDAIKRLIAHYDAGAPGDEIIAKKWSEKAISLGDADELYFSSARLLTKAYREIDAKKKSELLITALEYAKRSHLNNKDKNKDKSITKLIDDINKEITTRKAQ